MRVPAGGPWAEVVGYSRAVRVGQVVHVAGTAALEPDGRIAHPGDAYGQTRRCLELIAEALGRLGATPEQIVRTRLFVKRRADWRDVGRAHGEYFGATRPVTSMIFAELIDPELLVEIEAEAVIRFAPHFTDVPIAPADARQGG
ncbi:MAG: RidA family protein [Gemmatimonadetes bacterium]|nr:RidA family protein [Gemmatimonadota bacterium]